MPGGGRGLDRSGKGRKPAALRSFHPSGRSRRGSARAAAELAGERSSGWLAATSLRMRPVAISSLPPPTIAKSIGPSLKKPRAARSCATQRTIRPCATSSSVRSCSGASCRLLFRRRARVRRWRSGCGARSTLNCRRIWDRGSTNWDSCAAKSCRRCPRGRNAKLCCTNWRIARFVECRLAQREPLPAAAEFKHEVPQ